MHNSRQADRCGPQGAAALCTPRESHNGAGSSRWEAAWEDWGGILARKVHRVVSIGEGYGLLATSGIGRTE